MKRLVSVSAFKFSIKRSSYTYINQLHRYNIACRVLRQKMGLFNDSYDLEFDGNDENIQMFLDYLKNEGFKIKCFE